MSSQPEAPRPAGPYHEMLDASGRVRPHWRAFHRQLLASGQASLEARREQVARQIQENGITYNVYADPLGTDRPWELDLLPNLIPADEWQALAAGVAQRARLLDALLADLYGPQQLLSEGLLPPELVYGHENFLWPCQGIRPPGDTFLHVYAADLRRAPDGRWWVIADRTQAPSGAGYALENRQIVSRLFPEAFRQLRVQHLAGYFRTLRETLMNQAPRELGETPLVVVLTPGRFNETYFEHLYLSRQLGFPLVEGSDLTVRDATLYLKTLDGLQRVHGVLRRLDDNFCDPLELRADSALGVPGLLEAVRQGRVLVANALGSGVLESPGLLGFLPKIAQRLLGESLSLPSIATWWCGEAPVLEQALQRLEHLVVRPAFPSQRFAPVYGSELDAAGLARLAERLRARPYAYVAQELAQLSQAPVWQDGELQSRAIGMRVYAVASPWGYQVLPGGLTRVAGEPGAQEVTMQTGGGSKDTWVLAGRDSARGEPLAPRPLGAAQVIRRDPYLPSRVVENLFWFGRYAERCDDLTRLLRVMLSRYLGDDDEPAALDAAVSLAEGMGLLADGDSGALEERLFQALLGQDWDNGLRANLQRLNWSAAQVRGRLSQENWLTLMDIQREAHTLERQDAGFAELLDFLDRLLRTLSGLSGFAFDDMTRDDGWRFLMLGRRIERLQFLCESIAGFLAGRDPLDQAALEWLLELGNSTLTYRSRYLAVPQAIPVLDLLLLDEQNPHAVLFQLLKVQGGMAHIGQQFGEPFDASLAELEMRLRGVDLGSLESPLFGRAGQREVFDGLGRLLLEISAAVGQFAERLALRHFAHVDVSRQTVSL